MSTDAAYSGYCQACGEPYDVGTPIAHSDAYGWVHRTCPDPLAVTRPPCPKCFTIPAANGRCDCDE